MVPTYFALKTIYRIVMVSTKIEIQVWKWTHRDAVSSPGSSGLKIPLSTLHTALNEYRPLRGPPLVTIFETQPDKSVRVSSPKSPSRRYMH